MDVNNLAGSKLGNYEIESLLGRGGMSVVYKARQVNLDRSVALKILPPTLSSDASFVTRFQREARAVAKLSHSNIVQIFDITEEQNLHFFSMEYVDGKTLDKILDEKGKLEPHEAIRIISQAARAIGHAHKNNIIHRDVKPSNIILDDSGTVKVMDFGLAQAADELSTVTQAGTLIGTLAYMSPEQCRGENLDLRTDIYSLGVVLYEMLTGKTPFDAPNEAALINKIINEEPPEVRDVNRDITPDLSSIASCAMAKDKKNRYISIREFLEDVKSSEKLFPSKEAKEKEASPSIAVLPFVNMSADPEQEYFCDGLAEEIINALTQIRDLKVAARTSAFSFKGEKLNIDRIGSELKVKTVLEGSVRKAGNRLRITAQLVDVANGYHLWSERYDREHGDVFAIQDEITLAIVEKLKPKLLKKEQARVPKRQTADLEAYDLYLKGRWFAGRLNEEDLKRAIQYYEQALEKDPAFGAAYAGIAFAHTQLSFWGAVPKKAYARAREAALKALEIDNTLAEAHLALALVKLFMDYDWQEAEKGYLLAIESNPGSADTHLFYGRYLSYAGRAEEAIDMAERAIELDPLSLVANFAVGTVSIGVRRYDRAIEAFKRIIVLDPTFPRVHAFLALAYIQKSLLDEAMKELEKEKKISRGLDPLGNGLTGIAYAIAGETEKAQEILDELIEQSKHRYVSLPAMAIIYFYLGETDKGFEWLEKAYDERDPWIGSLKVNPAFDLIRGDPRCNTMLKKMNLG